MLRTLTVSLKPHNVLVNSHIAVTIQARGFDIVITEKKQLLIVQDI